MKKRPLFIMLICMFCLIVLSVNANNSAGRLLNAYPNPIDCGTVLTLEISGEHSEITVILYNTVGKVIRTFKTTNNMLKFNAPDIGGIYLLRVVENQKVIAVEKIIVKE